MPLSIKIGNASAAESVWWIELTFVNALRRFMSVFGRHPLLDVPISVVSSHSEQSSQTIAAAILLEDHVGFRSVHFKAYKGQKDQTSCMSGSGEYASFMAFLAGAD